MTEILKIRAHHLLCLQGFQGYGYNENFVKNIVKIIENLNSNPELRIITDCDIICSCCPHNIGEKCQKSINSSQRIKEMDNQVLSRLHLMDGTIGKAKDFLSLINTKLKNSIDVFEICGDCIWMEKCLWFISQN